MPRSMTFDHVKVKVTKDQGYEKSAFILLTINESCKETNLKNQHSASYVFVSKNTKSCMSGLIFFFLQKVNISI